MFELLYAIGVVFETFGLPGLCVLSMAIEWHTARWLSLRTADGMGRGKTSTTSPKDGHLVPGAYIDEILLQCVSPRLLSPSLRKLSLPGSRISIMSRIEICASPIQDDGGVSLVEGPLGDPQNDDRSGYVSDESVCFSQLIGFFSTHPLMWTC
jgi:hypothetical protein